MRFNKSEITSIAGDNLKDEKVEGNPEYEWIDIVGIPPRPSVIDPNLYLATHSEGEGGWDYGFDRRPISENVARDLGWHLAVEEGTPVGNAEYIRVESLNNLAESLYKTARERSNPYVVGVTGSVGKTTTVAFMEHLVSTSGNDAVRFYSKRLQPLSVMCHYINRVEEDTDIIVMEYSVYLPQHVEELSRVLPPNVSFMTNIYETHLSPGLFEDKQAIFSAKEKIKPSWGNGFVNNRVLQELQLPLPQGWSGFSVEYPESWTNPNLPPTLRTAELYTVGKILADDLSIPRLRFERAFETFQPRERRIIKCVYDGKDVYFHGETSGGSRLWSWFETTDGERPWLFVEEIDFADENPRGFESLLEQVFNSDKTLVLDTPQNRQRLIIPAKFVPESAFLSRLKEAEGYTIYHKALSTRNAEFDPQEYLEQRW